ncbi:hypothetical protein TCON_2345 [Astathelohania contejeani]|uniref:Uncharacterized protein n=1 Tax=Astathelohania contejeani TaxID=164912 RepID=A0ABQ7HWE7_9MICR|nr:hypothetical protein TCON_2345 [Thelohania contejeani]
MNILKTQLYCLLIRIMMVKGNEYTLDNIKMLINESIQYFENEINDMQKLLPNKYNFLDETMSKIDLVNKNKTYNLDKLKTEISQIMDLEINQITNLVDVLSKIYEKVEMFLKLILELKIEANIDSIEKIETRTANLYEKTSSLLKEFKCILEFDRKKFYMIKHSQTKWELKEIIEPLLKKRKSSDYIERDYRLIKETLRDLKILIKKLKRDTKQLDEKILERKIKIDDVNVNNKIKKSLFPFINSINEIKNCATNIKNIYDKFKAMNIDEQREINFKNLVILEKSDFDVYYKKILDYKPIFDDLLVYINMGYFSKKEIEYINHYKNICYDLLTEYSTIKKEIIPKLYSIYENEFFMKNLDYILIEAKEEFNNNIQEFDNETKFLIKEIYYINDRLNEIEKSVKISSKQKKIKNEVRFLFDNLNSKIDKFDEIMTNYFFNLNLLYNEYFEIITKKNDLQDDRLKNFIDELDAIKEDCDEYIKSIANKIPRKNQMAYANFCNDSNYIIWESIISVILVFLFLLIIFILYKLNIVKFFIFW